MAVFQRACNFNNDLVYMFLWAFKMLIAYKRNAIATILSSFVSTNYRYKDISPKHRYFFSDILSLCLRYLISVCT